LLFLKEKRFMATLQNIIDQAWEDRANLSPSAAPAEVREAVASVLAGLNDGSIRVAERESVGKWHVNQWVKKAVLISFRLEDNQVMSADGKGGFPQFYDKVPTKFANYTAADFAKGGFRVVPPATSILAHMWMKDPWLIHGQPLVHALKSVKTFTYLVAWVLVAYWSLYKLAQ
jgi:2,3,4,5-tetrahydropyridine-2,6-dicarboxylate N-succinyltransferase